MKIDFLINKPKLVNCNHHECHDKSCGVQAPHAHPPAGHEHDSCLTCMRDHIKGLTKQFLTTTSFLGTAIPTAKLASSLLKRLNLNSFVSSLITAPLSISTMHFFNRGTKNLDKLGLTACSSIGALGLTKIMNMQKFFLRPVMCLAVFLIEKLRPEQINNHNENKTPKLTKNDLVNLLKVQSLILTVPAAVGYFINKLENSNDQNNGFVNRFLGNIGITAFQVLSLSFGFVGLGKLIDTGIKHFNLKTNEGTMAMAGKVEAVIDVCAHCGIPGCIDSITESVDAGVLQAVAA